MTTPSRPAWGLVVGLCALAALLDGYDLQVLALAVPSMAADLGVKPTAMGPALAATLAGAAAGSMLLAPLADRFGRKALLVAALLMMGLPTLGVTFANAVPVVAALRFLAGLGFGAAVPVAVAMAAEHAPPARRALMVSLVVACTALGALTASIAAPAIEGWLGWRSLFVVGAIAPIALAPLYAILLPSGAPTGADKRGWSSPGPLFAAPLGLSTSLLWLTFGLSLATTAAVAAWLPTLLMSQGWPRPAAQHAVGFLAIGGVAGGAALGWLADRLRPAIVIAGAYGLAALALVGLWLGPPRALWSLVIIVIGVGAFGGQTVLAAAAARLYPDTLRSTGVGWASGVGRIFSVAGPLAAASLMAAGQAPMSVLAMLAVPLTICATLAIALGRSSRA